VPLAIGLPIPNAEDAIIVQGKLEGYLLDAEHPVGRHKARVFLAALGIRSADWRHLRDAILEGLTDSPVSAIESTSYGLRCTIVMAVEGLNGERRDIVTAWLIEEGRPPRFITAYVDL
jgi:hypothetical protein